MKEILFQKGINLENNTYYKATESRYDIYLSDCIVSENEVYFSYTIRHCVAHYVAFLLKDLENVTLDFGGATIVFHGRITPFIFDNCKNVKVVNCKIDYDRPFYTQAKVLECGEGRMRVRIDEGFSYRVEDGYLYATSETWEKKLNQNNCLLWLYDRTGVKSYGIILALFGPEIFPNDNPPGPIQQLLVEEDGQDLIFTGNFPSCWDYNDGNNTLLFTHEIRDKCTFTYVDCENVYLENVIIIHGAAVGVMAMHTKNMYFDNCSMYMDYEGNGRLVTNNADAIHAFNCSGEFILKNSYMDGMLDDIVNVHNNYMRVEAVNGDTITCKFPGAGVEMHCPLFCEKDEIGVLRGRIPEIKEKFTIVSRTFDLEKREHYFTLDCDAVGLVEVGDTIENLSGQAEILIENCTFGIFRGTTRLQSRKKTVVRNCEFRNRDCSLLFTGDTTYWFESGPVEDFLVENCKFLNSNYGPRFNFTTEMEFTDEAKYYHKNVTVRDCYFDGDAVSCLWHVENFHFEHNRAEGTKTIYAKESKGVVADADTIIK